MNFFCSDLRKQWENDLDNNLVRFKYAAVLAHSPSNEDKREAILHLEFLINHSPEYLETHFSISPN